MSQTIRHQTLNEKVYEELRRALMSGEFVPGEVLTIRRLADTYGTSTTPIREALRHLLAEQALVTLPNHSIKVPILTRTKFEELRDIRLALEGLATELATQRLDAKTLRRLRKLHAKIGEVITAEDYKAYLRHNEAFHFTIYRAAEAPTLIHFIESLWLQVGPFLNYLFRYSDFLANGNDLHADILAAMEQRDAERGKKAVQEDISVAAGHLAPLLEDAKRSRIAN